MKSEARGRIRRFRGADLKGVRRLIHRTIDASYSGVYPPRAVSYFKEFHSEEKILERQRTGVILVIEREGEVVATGAIVGQEILGVFVHPGLQGRGYGKALMVELEDRARARGFPVVELSVSLPSRGFYESLGYKLGEKRSLDVGAGQRLDFWPARKAPVPAAP